MPRTARLVAPGVVHHVVARGVDKCRIFRCRADLDFYLREFSRVAVESRVELHGYCLMNNHIHFLVTPCTPDGLERLFRRAHTRWAMYFNRKYNRSGHLFQGRYHSSPLDEAHYWTALRYIELNPCAANLIHLPEHWRWSSARAHVTGTPDCVVKLVPVVTRRQFTPEQWQEFLRTEPDSLSERRLLQSLRGSRPCGDPEWAEDIRWRFGPRRKSALIAQPAA